MWLCIADPATAALQGGMVAANLDDGKGAPLVLDITKITGNLRKKISNKRTPIRMGGYHKWETKKYSGFSGFSRVFH